jgi:hypothetical protein
MTFWRTWLRQPMQPPNWCGNALTLNGLFANSQQLVRYGPAARWCGYAGHNGVQHKVASSGVTPQRARP